MNGSATVPPVPSAKRRAPAVQLGAASYYLTSCAVFVGVWVGVYLIPSSSAWRGYVGSFGYVDGMSYAQIVDYGYADPHQSWLVRFPAYPLLARAVKRVTHTDTDTALVITAHACLLLVFVIMAKYLSARWADEPPGLVAVALLALGLWPGTLWFRLAYTESLMLLCVVLTLYAMERRWPHVLIAVIVGLATGTRPVGVALVVVFAWHLWQESRRACPAAAAAGNNADPRCPPAPWRAAQLALFLRWAACLLPLACWGLLAFMLFLQVDFHEALAFAARQQEWVGRPTPLAGKLIPLMTLEPIWSPYVPGTTTYWRNEGSPHNPLFNHSLLNPIVFLLTVVLVVVGGLKKWLNSRELMLSVLLLGIPYVTMAYDNLMVSQPRFASVIFPVYMVMARLLWPLPRWASAIFLVLCAGLLGMYSAYFAAGYGQTYQIFY
jgi:hypothetical protein